MEVLANYLGASQFEAIARGHKVFCDQPLENGGFDEGMKPPEFLLVSLATCAGYYAAQYLNGRKLPSEGLNVRVSAEKARLPARLPARLASFQIEVTVPGLDDRHQEGILRAAKACLIHNTLLGAPSMEVMVNTGMLAA